MSNTPDVQIRMSESIANLAIALAKFQAAAPIITKSKTAKVLMKSGGEYSYKYASLGDVTKVTYPLLAAQDLAVIFPPSNGNALVGMLVHKSGEWIAGDLDLPGNAMQEVGSALTYAKRYLIGCLTGVVTDEDDDGRGANGAEPRQPRQARGRNQEAPTLQAKVATGPKADVSWAVTIEEADSYVGLQTIFSDAEERGVLTHILPSGKSIRDRLFERREELKKVESGE